MRQDRTWQRHYRIQLFPHMHSVTLVAEWKVPNGTETVSLRTTKNVSVLVSTSQMHSIMLCICWCSRFSLIYNVCSHFTYANVHHFRHVEFRIRLVCDDGNFSGNISFRWPVYKNGSSTHGMLRLITMNVCSFFLLALVLWAVCFVWKRCEHVVGFNNPAVRMRVGEFWF